MDKPDLTSWKITGLIAILVVILSIPLYMLKERRGAGKSAGAESRPEAAFVGSVKCASCHKAQFDKWETSDHRFAMAPASDESVRGDFNDTEFEHFGVTSTFYRKNGKYFAHTQGPGGKMGEFEVTHTFGLRPLQQYLIPFPGGRLQCLPIAWDVEKKR